MTEHEQSSGQEVGVEDCVVRWGLNGVAPSGKLGTVTTPEAARLDLYNGLSDLLCPERAETLMTYLHIRHADELATRFEQEALRSEFSDLRSEMNAGLAALSLRMDRLFLTMVAGLLAILAAMAAILVTVA